MFDRDGNTRSFAAGLVIGGLIGAGIALLFAPQSGVETRRVIRRKAKRLVDDAQDRFDEVKDRARQVRRRAQDVIGG